jgi:hypothetical protein
MAPDGNRPDPITLISLLPRLALGRRALLRKNLRVRQSLQDERRVPLPNFDFDRCTCRQLQYRRLLTRA